MTHLSTAQRSRAAAEVAEVENQKAALERRVAEGLQELEEEQQGGSEGVLERESHVQVGFYINVVWVTCGQSGVISIM